MDRRPRCPSKTPPRRDPSGVPPMTPIEPNENVSVDRASGRLPVAPSLAPTLEAAHVPLERSTIDRRVLLMSGLGVGLGLAASALASVLMALIGLITNLAFYGRWSFSFVGPAGHPLGWVVLPLPRPGGG